MRKGAGVYLAASLTSQAAALLRYVLLARILGPEQLGLAAMLILTSQFFDSVTDTGSDRFLIQDPEGDSPRMQGFVQMVMAGRGLLIALALALTAIPLAAIYHAPTLTPALMVLGLSPFILGFVHLDIRRLQRHGDMRQESAMTIFGEMAGLIGTVWAALVVRDHTAVIYGLVARSIAMVIASHIAAQRAYGWAFAKTEGIRFSRFAAPLFVNGLLLYAGSQGDRLIVGSRLGATALGHYSAVLLLIYYPSSALSKYVMGMHLPQVANSRPVPALLEQQSQRLAGRCLLLAVLMAAGFTLVGPVVTPLLYGRAFAQGIAIFAFLACLQSARFLRVWPTTMAVAIGRSTIVMFNNIARMVALPAAILLTLKFHSLEAIVAGFFLGEIAALVVALVLLARGSTVSLTPELKRVGGFLLVSAALWGTAWGRQNHQLVWTVLAAAATCVAVVWVAWSERSVIAEFYRSMRRQIERRMARAKPTPSG